MHIRNFPECSPFKYTTNALPLNTHKALKCRILPAHETIQTFSDLIKLKPYKVLTWSDQKKYIHILVWPFQHSCDLQIRSWSLKLVCCCCRVHQLNPPWGKRIACMTVFLIWFFIILLAIRAATRHLLRPWNWYEQEKLNGGDQHAKLLNVLYMATGEKNPMLSSGPQPTRWAILIADLNKWSCKLKIDR